MNTKAKTSYLNKIAKILFASAITSFIASYIITGLLDKPTYARYVEPNKKVRSYTEKELSEYNGTDLNKPIYLAYEGKVYDVTEGEKFYKTGGTYHFLAGKDSTKELNIAGGKIIKKKYPVIGLLKDN